MNEILLIMQMVSLDIQSINFKEELMNLKQSNKLECGKIEEVYSTAKKKIHIRDRDTSTERNVMDSTDIGHVQGLKNKLSKAKIKQLYQNLMERSEYTQAEKTGAVLRYLSRKQQQNKIRKLSLQHSIQSQTIRASHLNQMKLFRQSWRQVFMEQAMKQRSLIQKLGLMRQADESECRNRIKKRCQSAKPRTGLSKLYEIEQVQKLLRKRGKTSELRQVRAEKKRIIEKCKKQQEQSLVKIAQEQKKRMGQKHTRRYHSFMHRIEQSRRDNERIYKREQHKLKQKYRNILKNLQHDQALDFQEIKI